MSRGRELVLCAVAALTIGACGGGGGPGDPTQESGVVGMAGHTDRAARRFTEKIDIAGRTLVVAGLVEDDHRYQATVSVDGRAAYQEVVADDARYVRVLDAALVSPTGDPAALAAVDPSYQIALGGQWVTDPRGAPPEFTQGSKLPGAPLGPEVVTRAVRYMDDARELARKATEFNKDSISYLPKNDRFKHLKVEDTKRWDVLPSHYDPLATTVTLADVEKYFESAALWVDDHDVRRVEELTEFPDPRRASDTKEMYRQISRAGSDSLQALVKMFPRVAGSSRIAVSYEVKPDPKAAVSIPTDAVRVDLRAATAKAPAAFGALLKIPGPLTDPPT